MAMDMKRRVLHSKSNLGLEHRVDDFVSSSRMFGT